MFTICSFGCFPSWCRENKACFSINQWKATLFLSLYNERQLYSFSSWCQKFLRHPWLLFFLIIIHIWSLSKSCWFGSAFTFTHIWPTAHSLFCYHCGPSPFSSLTRITAVTPSLHQHLPHVIVNPEGKVILFKWEASYGPPPSILSSPHLPRQRARSSGDCTALQTRLLSAYSTLSSPASLLLTLLWPHGPSGSAWSSSDVLRTQGIHIHCFCIFSEHSPLRYTQSSLLCFLQVFLQRSLVRHMLITISKTSSSATALTLF